MVSVADVIGTRHGLSARYAVPIAAYIVTELGNTINFFYSFKHVLN